MMQKTSLNKVPYNIFLFTFKKSLGFSLVASILALLVSPIYLYSVITNYIENYNKLIYDSLVELLSFPESKPNWNKEFNLTPYVNDKKTTLEN